MATKQLQSTSVPMPARPKSRSGAINEKKPRPADTRIVVIVYGRSQDKIVSVFADVLGKPYRLALGFSAVNEDDRGTVIGIGELNAEIDIRERSESRIVATNTHCVNLGTPPDLELFAACDYEFLYTQTPFFRRDLSRFIALILGQISRHDALISKPRTYFISTAFPDVRTALSNLDILSVGSDAVEIRVDLLKEPFSNDSYSTLPSLSYVGERSCYFVNKLSLLSSFTTR